MTRSRTKTLVAAVVVAFLVVTGSAVASWVASGSGNAFSKGHTVDAGNTPTATVSNRNVTVNWAATGGSVPVAGYIVKRYNASGTEQTIGSNCSGTITATTCTENAVPGGNWRYTVTPVRQNWRGNESAQSAAVTVNAPSLTLSPTYITSLPQALTGQINNFLPGQTVTFRLDNQSSGTVLTGSITPSPTPASGTSTVNVTLPAGTTRAPHTIYAIGSSGDVASYRVRFGAATTAATPAYDIRDASSGTEQNMSTTLAFAGDGRQYTTNDWPAGTTAGTFNANNYIEFELNSPLRTDATVSSGTFNFRMATEDAGSQACFYVEGRKVSDNSLVATYGSAASPFCTTAAQTQTNFSVPITGFGTGALANDMKLRVYGRTSGTSNAFVVDLATASLTTGDGNFTLYSNKALHAYTTGGGGTTTGWWSQAFDDDRFFTDANSWLTNYDANRYFEATFPGYVPTDADIQSATLIHRYRASAAGQVCNYVEILAGTTVIGTHGSATADQSCSSSTTADTVDTIDLPEVDTPAEANSLSAKIYMKRGTAANTAQHDQVRLVVTYFK